MSSPTESNPGAQGFVAGLVKVIIVVGLMMAPVWARNIFSNGVLNTILITLLTMAGPALAFVIPDIVKPEAADDSDWKKGLIIGVCLGLAGVVPICWSVISNL